MTSSSARVLSDSIVRVKIWSADGRVLYSDDPAQIGGRYALSRRPTAPAPRGRRAGGGNRPRPSRKCARPQAGAVDRGVHADPHPRRAPPMLFEIYQRFGSVTASARRLLVALALPILGAIALILLVQVPLLRLADAPAAARPRGARSTARERGCSVAAGAAARRFVSTRRARCRTSPVSHSRSRRWPTTRLREVRPETRRPSNDRRPPTRNRSRSSCAARRLVSAEPCGRGARGGYRRPRQPTANARCVGRGGGGRSRAPRPRAAGARLPRRAGGRSQRDRVCRRQLGPVRAQRPPTRSCGSLVSDDGRGSSPAAGTAHRGGSPRALPRRRTGNAVGREPRGYVERGPRGRASSSRCPRR